jgi:hypothetical protein
VVIVPDPRSERVERRSRHRSLATRQACVVNVADVEAAEIHEILRTDERLLEAPNWMTPDSLILNGDGYLWSVRVSDGRFERLELPGLPEVNNDHVPAPGGDTMYVSGYDGHIHRVVLSSGETSQVTRHDVSVRRFHFLHGVNPEGDELAYVEIEPDDTGWGPGRIATIPAAGGERRTLTSGARHADGPEYSRDGEWIYFNTEGFTDEPGHAQIARMRTDGRDLTQLTFDDRVNWFPHLSPDGDRIVYLSYPPGTLGHPADLDVELRMVVDDDWSAVTTVARLTGGQGTINVNSWAPDGTAFAFVSYPIA